MSVRDPLVLERWRAIFATWRSSGLSVAAFCRSRALNTSSFYCWRNICDGSIGLPILGLLSPSCPSAWCPIRSSR